MSGRYLSSLTHIKKWRIKMKKLLFIMAMFAIMLTGCGKHNEGNADTQVSGEPTVTEDQAVTEDAETEKPAVTEDAEPENQGEILTDSTQITGLAKAIIENMTLEEKVGQMFIVNLESLDATQGTYYEHRTFTDEMLASLQEFPVGGVTLFSRNIETRSQTMKLNSDLQSNSRIPLWISVDEEGGDVARIANNPNMKMTQFPSMEVIGATEDAEYCYDMGTTIGNEISELGFNLDFAPVADVRTNENNTEIGNRSFGDDANLVASLSSSVVKGLQSTGVSATLKHFPGHGDAEGDTHQASVNIGSDINRLRTVDFVPFKTGIKAGADFIMISHISISRVAGNTTPASLSSLVMKDIVRNELEFKGVVITDAMDMKAITNNYTAGEAAVKAIKAGADVVLMPADFVEAYNTVVNAVLTEDISEARINESVQRILETKIKRGLILYDTDLIHKQ